MTKEKDTNLNNAPEEQKPTTAASDAQLTQAAAPTDNGKAEESGKAQPTAAATATTPAATTTQPGGATPATEKVSTPPSQPTQTATAPTQPEAKKRMTYSEMWERLNDYTPQTAEEKEAERKRQRRKAIFAAIGDGVSALANLYYTSKGALNAYDGKNTMSGKLKEQWEKDRKERRAKDKEYLTGYMQAQKWDDDAANADRSFEYQKGRDQVADDHWNSTFNFQKEQADKAEGWRQKDYDFKVKQAEEEQKRWVKTFNERKRQNDRTYALSVKRLNHDISTNNGMTFTVGNGDSVFVSKDRLNAGNVARVFSKLPQTVRDGIKGEPIYTSEYGMKVPTGRYKQPTVDDMLIAIGQYSDDPDVAAALRQIGGRKGKTLGLK